MDTVAGVALNGVVILGSSSMEKVDPFYPKTWSGSSQANTELVDACLGHPQPQGIYHYHILSPCIKSTTGILTTKACGMMQNCISDIKSYALNSYTSYQNETLLGVAKDGHMIMGPYDSTG